MPEADNNVFWDEGSFSRMKTEQTKPPMRSLKFLPNRSYLKNQRGVAALLSIILGLLLVAVIGYSFTIEVRGKQKGSIFTYTSANAFMIAEAGLRYTEKCLLKTDATWGCPEALQAEADWRQITSADHFDKSFGGGDFSVTFPANDQNDENNIWVESIGSYKGAVRSFSRFVSRAGICSGNAEPITSCESTEIEDGFTITPLITEEPVTGVCPDDPPGIVGPFADLPAVCNSCPNTSCPDFDTDEHLLAGNILDPSFTRFCDFQLKEIAISTQAATHNNLVIAKALEMQDDGVLVLNGDAPEDTTLTVYGDAKLQDDSKIKVKGTLTLNVSGKLTLQDSSELNFEEGATSAWIEGDFEMQGDAKLVGSVNSDGTLKMDDQSYVKGALFYEEGGACTTDAVSAQWSE